MGLPLFRSNWLIPFGVILMQGGRPFLPPPCVKIRLKLCFGLRVLVFLLWAGAPLPTKLDRTRDCRGATDRVCFGTFPHTPFLPPPSFRGPPRRLIPLVPLGLAGSESTPIFPFFERTVFWEVVALEGPPL